MSVRLCCVSEVSLDCFIYYAFYSILFRGAVFSPDTVYIQKKQKTYKYAPVAIIQTIEYKKYTMSTQMWIKCWWAVKIQGPANVLFSFELNLESNRPYTTQAITQPNGLQAYRRACYSLQAYNMLTTSIVNVCCVCSAETAHWDNSCLHFTLTPNI